MARRERKSNETLSQETPEVQEALLSELTASSEKPVVIDMTEEKIEEPIQNMHLEVQETKPEDLKEIQEEVKKIEEITNAIRVGDRVKIKPEVGNDIVGRRIHNGIKNYLYTVKAVRNDGYITIECLTYVFTLSNKDLEFIKRG